MRKTSTNGLNLIRRFEGEKLTAYRCPAGIWTIGVGHTGPDVYSGLTITEERSLELLRADVSTFEAAVNSLVRVPLNQNQFDALVSFVFNVGNGALKGSTLLRKLNAGDYEGAAKEFGRWTKALGQTLTGLIKRRAAEAGLFLAKQV